jgi:hypothetical protein
MVKDYSIKNKIFTIRNIQVMLDRDLAEFYEIKATRLREQVNRNIKKFPDDFMFELSAEEINDMVSQNAIPSKQHLGGSKPMVFTEQGVSMLPSVLRSDKATQISIEIIRTFVNMRRFISQNNFLFNKLDILEEKQKSTNQKVDEILLAIESKNTTVKQGIFFEGQFFDAYIFITDILKQAEESVTLIDNYIDENTLLHLNSKTNKNIKISIITKSITSELKLDIKKYTKQYNNLSIYEYKNSHDRFLIIDNKIIYHLGASLKDLGNKWFAFSKLEDDNLELLNRVSNIRNDNP